MESSTRNKKRHFITVIYSENISILDICVPNIMSSKFIRQNRTKELGGSLIIVLVFNKPLSGTDRIIRQKRNKDGDGLSKTSSEG